MFPSLFQSMPPTIPFHKNRLTRVPGSVTSAFLHLSDGRKLCVTCDTDVAMDMGSYLASYVKAFYEGLSGPEFLAIASQRHPHCRHIPNDVLCVDYLITCTSYIM